MLRGQNMPAIGESTIDINANNVKFVHKFAVAQSIDENILRLDF